MRQPERGSFCTRDAMHAPQLAGRGGRKGEGQEGEPRLLTDLTGASSTSVGLHGDRCGGALKMMAAGRQPGSSPEKEPLRQRMQRWHSQLQWEAPPSPKPTAPHPKSELGIIHTADPQLQDGSIPAVAARQACNGRRGARSGGQGGRACVSLQLSCRWPACSGTAPSRRRGMA